jgi:hypothetical protein
MIARAYHGLLLSFLRYEPKTRLLYLLPTSTNLLLHNDQNQDVIDLIDFKGTGIINILHDQCRTPGATDKSFSMLMYETCSPHSRFEADSRQMAGKMFAIHHYAG